MWKAHSGSVPEDGFVLHQQVGSYSSCVVTAL
ncbi:hypothetical protein CD31A_0637 [Corynebacterium diphtheriae 31A]|nr:hypothetical protein CD31A_0637 [Corynebacterium diphtheriae 31A]AEX78290.1 hypothetical protein CDHC03_0559 [Corynebacterium diphtheriae HC03]